MTSDQPATKVAKRWAALTYKSVSSACPSPLRSLVLSLTGGTGPRPLFGLGWRCIRLIMPCAILQPPFSCRSLVLGFSLAVENSLRLLAEGLMPITKLPEMVACAGAVLVSSDSHARDPILTVTLDTEEGDRYMLPLSERAMTQLTELITGWRRTRDFSDQQEISLQ